MIIINCEQRSEEWLKLRAGNPGASNADKIITTKGDISKQRDDYLRQLAGETITGKCEEGFTSQHMLAGIEREDASRSLFELTYGVDVVQVGLVYKDDRRAFHSSPDGLVGDDAVLELKNPMLKTHVKYLLEGTLPQEYFTQVQMILYTTERKLCYFMSCYEGMPPFIVEVKRDEKFIGLLGRALDSFARDLDVMVSKLREITGGINGTV